MGDEIKDPRDQLIEKLTGRWATCLGIFLGGVGVALTVLVIFFAFVGYTTFSDIRKTKEDIAKEMSDKYQYAIRSVQGSNTWIDFGKFILVAQAGIIDTMIVVEFREKYIGRPQIFFSQSTGYNAYVFQITEVSPSGFEVRCQPTGIAASKATGIPFDNMNVIPDTLNVSWLAIGKDLLRK